MNFQFHGWAVIQADYVDSFEREDENEKALAEAIIKIEEYIRDNCRFTCRVSSPNGLNILTINGCSNHYRSLPLELFQFVAKIATGSHGLLYVLDLEDANGWDNCYQVWVLKKGTLNRTRDQFLSPYEPEIWEREG